MEVRFQVTDASDGEVRHVSVQVDEHGLVINANANGKPAKSVVVDLSYGSLRVFKTNSRGECEDPAVAVVDLS